MLQVPGCDEDWLEGLLVTEFLSHEGLCIPAHRCGDVQAQSEEPTGSYLQVVQGKFAEYDAWDTEGKDVGWHASAEPSYVEAAVGKFFNEQVGALRRQELLSFSLSQTDRQTDRQTTPGTNRQTDAAPTDRQTGRQTDRQTHPSPAGAWTASHFLAAAEWLLVGFTVVPPRQAPPRV